MSPTGPQRTNMERLEEIVAILPEWERVDIAAWDHQPTFRVRGKNFVFTDPEATRLTVKLTRDEAAAVVATDERVTPTGYGLGRHGWITIDLPPSSSERRWREVTEWIRTSYTLVAPKRLALLVQEKEPDQEE